MNLFTREFLGAAVGDAGEPWLRARFYDPDTPTHRDATNNPADPPDRLTRNCLGATHPRSVDDAIIAAPDYPTMRALLESAHDAAHEFIGGTLNDPHVCFRDPVAFLIHANADKLFSQWQTQPGHPERLDPASVYGSESGAAGLNGGVEPWSSGHTFDTYNVEHFVRPWCAPEMRADFKNYKYPSVVTPRLYDVNLRPLTELIVHAGNVLDGVQATGGTVVHPRVGGVGGGRSVVALDPDDPIVEVSGFKGSWFGWRCVLQITVKTRAGKTHGPFGDMEYAKSRVPFTLTGQPGESLLTLYGKPDTVPLSEGCYTQIVTELNALFG